jgi:hypothetical protein
MHRKEAKDFLRVHNAVCIKMTGFAYNEKDHL